MERTKIDGLLTLVPEVYEDQRGFFYESFSQAAFDDVIGQHVRFLQDNHSKSYKGVLRGLHFQQMRPQGKLVRVTCGEVFDVAVDLRQGSPTFGQWVGEVLSADNRRQVWVPEGFAHGFLVLSDVAELLYKVTDYYVPADEQCIRWDDPVIGIEWPLDKLPLLSPRDGVGLSFTELFNLKGVNR